VLQTLAVFWLEEFRFNFPNPLFSPYSNPSILLAQNFSVLIEIEFGFRCWIHLSLLEGVIEFITNYNGEIDKQVMIKTPNSLKESLHSSKKPTFEEK
jgi:hypothetical protein